MTVVRVRGCHSFTGPALAALAALFLISCSSSSRPEIEGTTAQAEQAVTASDAATNATSLPSATETPSSETASNVVAGTGTESSSTTDSKTGPQKVSFEASGVLLGSVDTGTGNIVQFRDTPNAGIVTITAGPNNANTPTVDDSRLVGKSVTDIYRGLAGAEPPQALLNAEKRYGAQPIGSGVTDNKAVAPTRQEAASKPPKASGGVSPMWSQDPTYFQNSYCNQVGTGYGTYWDQGWCPVNVGWAHSGWGAYQKAYKVCGATTSSTGTLWYDMWVEGVGWQRQVTWDFSANQIGCLNKVGVGYFRSGMDSSTGEAVDYSERFRFAIPTISEALGDFPNNVNYVTFSGNWQGLTHDQNNWYMSMYYDNGFPTCSFPVKGLLGSMPLTGPSNDPLRTLYYGPNGGSYIPALVNAGLTHYGDLVYANGRLYVAVYNPAVNIPTYGYVAVFNQDMSYVGVAYLPNWSGGISGIAYNPRDNLFYAAQDKSTLKGYTIAVNESAVTATCARTVYLNDGSAYREMISGGGQGGKATPWGNLLWDDGYKDNPDDYKIWAIDLITGYVQWYVVGPHGASDEFEGLDIYDTDADSRFGAYKLGQIHLMQFGLNCGGNSSYWLSHFRVNDPAHL